MEKAPRLARTALLALFALPLSACAVPIYTAPVERARPAPPLYAQHRLAPDWTTPARPTSPSRDVRDAPRADWETSTGAWDLTRPGAAPVRSPGTSPGLFGLDIPVRGSISYLHEDIVSAGLFVKALEGLTVGAVMQSAEDGTETAVYEDQLRPDFTSEPTLVGVLDNRRTRTSFGPLIQARIVREDDGRPYVGLGGYALLWGDDKAEEVYSVYAVASKGVSQPLGRELRFDVGVGYMWRKAWRPVSASFAGTRAFAADVRFDYVDDDGWQGWAGVSLELVEDVSIFAQVASVPRCTASFVIGVRWSTPLGIDISIGLYECLGEETSDPFFAMRDPSIPTPMAPGGASGASYSPSAGAGGAQLSHLWGD